MAALLIGLCSILLLSPLLLVASDLTTPPLSPPAPAPSAGGHGSSPAPAPSTVSPPAPPSPGAAPKPNLVVSDINTNGGGGVAEKEGSEGMSGGKKAGIAVGVIVGAAVIGIGAVVYKKRQSNVQRSQYGYAARRELL